MNVIDHGLTFDETKVVLRCSIPNRSFHSVLNFSQKQSFPLLCLEPDMVVHSRLYAAPFKVR